MIAQNIRSIREKIAEAALKAGRDPGSIQLCAATKMNDAENVRQAIAAGVDCCGENRVQELTQKLSENAYEGAPVHFIGHLQTTKVKQVVGKVDLIQSVDSLRLLEAIQKEAAKQDIVQDILLEILLTWLKDALLVAREYEDGIINKDRIQELENVAGHIPEKNFAVAFSFLSEERRKMGKNPNIRLWITDVLISLREVLHDEGNRNMFYRMRKSLGFRF